MHSPWRRPGPGDGGAAASGRRRSGRLRAALGRGRICAALGLGAGALLASGCGKKMGDGDCQRIGASLQQAWDADVKRATPEDGAVAATTTAFLQSEGNKLASEWISDCKREMAGRAIAPEELACVTSAKTLDALARCAER